jgi:putative CocE/NonD family hydrolase
MKMRNRKLITVLTIVVLIIGLMIGGTEALAEKISRPFQYSGYTFPEYRSHDDWSEYVSMSDGTKLAVKVYLPSDGPSTGPFPVLFTHTPYHQENIDPATGKLMPIWAQEAIDFFTSYGYAMVIAGMRGSGASYGFKQENSPQLAKDGKQLVDWIGAQPWCNGKVGMVGYSYTAWSQYATAGKKPAALKCIFPEEIYFDAFTSSIFYPGGIGNKGVWDLLNMVLSLYDLNFYISPAGFFPSAPVVDEDADGDLADEIPLDLNNNGSFLDDGYPPQYSDGNPREHIYYKATLEHLNNPYYNYVPNAPYRDSDIPGVGTYSSLGPNDWPIRIAESGIAVYNVSGWFDAYPKFATHWYATLKATNPSKMFLAPSTHETFGIAAAPPGPYWGYFGIDTSQIHRKYNNERLRFFDRYLKGIKNGIDKEPPIYIYVMNGRRWRFENEWPIGRQVITNYYFSEGNKLTMDRRSQGSDNYVVDFTHDARQNGSHRWTPIIAEVLKRTTQDPKCLTYTSEPLKQDTEVTGHPIVRFWVSSTANDGDFFVYFEDVDENGEAYLVSDGQLRANFANLISNEDLLPPGSGMDVLPDLPWHGFKQSDYTNGIFSGGKKVELVIDLNPTSWVFKMGHRIRVSVAGVDWPEFQLHPALSPTNNPNDPNNIIPTIRVYRDAKHPSRIELPVNPRKPILFEGTAKIKTSAEKYEGPAELYTFTNDVYLHYEDQWIKWEVIKNWQEGYVEHYKGEGELGKLSVLIQNNDKASFDVLATGQGVHFKGNAQP